MRNLRRPRRQFRSFRNPRGAIDLASIMVGVLVSGIVGSAIAATVTVVVSWSQDEAAKQALDAVNTAESTVLVLGGQYLAYDSHPDSTYHALEGDPGVERPTARLIVDVEPGGWVAGIESDTGAVFLRTSESPEVFNAEDQGYLMAAGAGSYSGVRMVTVPDAITAALPTGFDKPRVQTLVDMITGKARSTPFAFPTGTPGVGPAAEAPVEPVVSSNGGVVTTFANITPNEIRDITVDSTGNVYTLQSGATSRVMKTTPAGIQSRVNKYGVSFLYTWGIAVDSTNRVFLADDRNYIGKVTYSAYGAYAGNYIGFRDGQGTAAQMNNPGDVAADSAGNLYVADTGNARIRKVSSTGAVTTVAGISSKGHVDGDVSIARLTSPTKIAVDDAGSIYFVDSGRVKKISGGMVSTIALLSDASGIAAGSDGTVYLTGSTSNKVYQIKPNGSLEVLAGSGALSHADGTGADASFNKPMGVAVDHNDVVYVIDNDGQIRKIV